MTTEHKIGIINLASASPRRYSLLEITGWQANVCPVEIDEHPFQHEMAEVLVERLALTKARAAVAYHNPIGVVLAADTVVADGECLLGKPADKVEAKRMLSSLKGRSHRVLTTLVLIDQRTEREVIETCETLVPMRDYEMNEVETYIASGAPLDKAGGYGIQDDAFCPVAVGHLQGCYTNVMGLPLCHLVRAMSRLGGSPPVNVPQTCQAYTGYNCPVYNDILREQA
jgi:MAF protein